APLSPPQTPPSGAAGGGRGAAAGGGGVGPAGQGAPPLKPPDGKVSAINLDRGENGRPTAHGETPANRPHPPALKGVTIPRTGQNTYNVGTLVTKSLIVAGEAQLTTLSDGSRGAMLRAYDKSTGKEVGAVRIPAPQSGSPMTYTLKGKQYIVVAV